MTTTTTPITDLRRPALARHTAMALAVSEYDRIAAAIAALSPADWTRPTDCPAWDVRQLCCHVVGMAEMVTGLRETRRQQRAAGQRLARDGGVHIDALTAIQVDERADWTPAQVVAAVRSVGPRAGRGRRRTPGWVRRRRMPGAQHVNGADELWSLGFLLDVILTRDPWMHRMDLARATGADPVLTADHDGVLVADVVAEWAQRHGQPFRLTLTGPAGGRWEHGAAREQLELDAVDFCRIVSGRPVPGVVPGEGLLATQVPF